MSDELQPNSDEEGEQSAEINLSVINAGTVPPITSDELELAKAEKKELFSNPGEKTAYERAEKLKDLFAKIARSILLGLAILLFATISIRVYHLLAPGCGHWLSENQISKVDQLFNYLIVGSIGGTLFKYFQTNIGLKE